jgi:hypothetical protein
LTTTEADARRHQEIASEGDIEILHLKLSEATSRERFHDHIDGVVERVRHEKAGAIDQGAFEAFSFGHRSDPEYWATRGALSVTDTAQFRVKRDVTALFGFRHKALQRAILRLDDARVLWFPELRGAGVPPRSDWDNVLHDDGRIVETATRFTTTPDEETSVWDGYQRVVFAKYRDPLFGNSYYRFVGVYVVDGRRDGVTTYQRVAEAVTLSR